MMEHRRGELLDLPAWEGAIRVTLAHLDRAVEAAPRLQDPGDAEALHDVRVALRRLRSHLRAYAPLLVAAVPRKRRRRIGELASFTNACRDAEVQLEWLEARQLNATIGDAIGIEWLRLELERRFEVERERVLEQVPDRLRALDGKLRRRLEDLRTTARAGDFDQGLRFSAALERRLTEAAAELDAALARVRDVSDEDEAHRSRIRAKRVRYLLEPVASEVPGAPDRIRELEELQDLLGDLHDRHVMDSLVAGLELGAGLVPAPAAAASGLRTVREWLRAEQEALFERLEESWLGERRAPFFAALEAVGEALASEGSAGLEIERKYLLSGLPTTLEGQSYREIDQGYLPGKKLQERVRRVREKGARWHERTVKVGRGIRRLELQEEADADTFEALWPLTVGRRVTKRRYRVADGGLTWEVDAFTDRDLVLAEVELPSEDARPELPEWLAPYVVREVTGDPEYLNVNLAR